MDENWLCRDIILSRFTFSKFLVTSTSGRLHVTCACLHVTSSIPISIIFKCLVRCVYTVFIPRQEKLDLGPINFDLSVLKTGFSNLGFWLLI